MHHPNFMYKGSTKEEGSSDSVPHLLVAPPHACLKWKPHSSLRQVAKLAFLQWNGTANNGKMVGITRARKNWTSNISFRTIDLKAAVATDRYVTIEADSEAGASTWKDTSFAPSALQQLSFFEGDFREDTCCL